MTDLEKLLKDEEIEAYIRSHQSQEEKIIRAARKLAGKKDAKDALMKLFYAFEQNKIFVFFSYKNKDEDTARLIVKKLEEWSAKKFEIDHHGCFKKDLVGQKWRERIRKSIDKANWFIFLLPDPKDDWDWCLFETGLFEARSTSADRLICLHHSDVKIPNPIEGYQSVSAAQDQIEDFLRMAFIENDPIPGMDAVNDSLVDQIPNMAKELVEVIKTPIQTVKIVFEPWVELVINNPENLEHIHQLDEAIILSANQKALDLFDLLEEKTTWEEFRENIDIERDNRWLVELIHVVKKIGKGHRYNPIQAVFKARDGKMYRPTVCAIDREGLKGPIRKFHLTFSEDVSTVDRSAMPEKLSLLANLLRSAFRFRWEVLEKYTKKQINVDDLGRIDNAIYRIEQDWESRALGREDEIIMLFNDGEGRGRLREMMKAWHQARNYYKTGVLDVAIKEKDVEVASKVLQSFLQPNQDFLEIASERFSNLIANR